MDNEKRDLADEWNSGIDSYNWGTLEGKATYCNGNFQQYMKKVILIKSLNNRMQGVPISYLWSPNESSKIYTGLHSVELLLKGVPWKS